MRNILLAGALVVAFVSGCTSPVQYTSAKMQRANERTRWVAEPDDGGFLLTVEYGQYQAFPVPSEVARAGRSELLFLAGQVAKDKGRSILPVQDSAIRESSGRNGLSGITTWSGQAQVRYAPMRTPKRRRKNRPIKAPMFGKRLKKSKGISSRRVYSLPTVLLHPIPAFRVPVSISCIENFQWTLFGRNWMLPDPAGRSHPTSLPAG